MTQETVKQIIFKREVYKKHPWFIPIERVGNVYITGQEELTTDQKLGKSELSTELKKKFPFVIHPEDQHQVMHLQKFNTEDSYYMAMYNLIIASKLVADSQASYEKTPARFVGYFFDKEKDAVSNNAKEDHIFEAQSLIRAASLEKHRHVATLLNYFVKGKFYIPVTTISPDILKNRLIKACYENTDEVKKCFPKHNKGIEKFSFILELLDYELIRETERGEFFYEAEPLGSSIDEVIAKLAKYEGKEIRRLLETKLQKRKQGLPVEEREDPTSFQTRIKDLKVLYVDGQMVAFKEDLLRLNADFPELVKDQQYVDEMDKLESFLEGPKDIKSIGAPPEEQKSEEEKLREKLSKKGVTKLQNSISHHTNAEYKKEECVEFWDDKAKLIDYMVDKKLNNAD